MAKSGLFFVYENETGDVSFYLDLGEVAASIEAVDVANGEYKLYDAEGHRIGVYAHEGGVCFDADIGPEDPAENRTILLRSLIRYFERKSDPIVDTQDLTFERLVEYCRTYAKDYPDRDTGLMGTLAFAPLALLRSIVGWFRKASPLS